MSKEMQIRVEQYTTVRPTEPGHYWMRNGRSVFNDPVPVEVWASPINGDLCISGLGRLADLSGYEWSGPVQLVKRGAQP